MSWSINNMPTVATFNGIKIEMYGGEHPPPHFHARYAEFIAQIGIEDLGIIEGSPPIPQLRLARQWAASRQIPLLVAWTGLEREQHPGKIP